MVQPLLQPRLLGTLQDGALKTGSENGRSQEHLLLFASPKANSSLGSGLRIQKMDVFQGSLNLSASSTNSRTRPCLVLKQDIEQSAEPEPLRRVRHFSQDLGSIVTISDSVTVTAGTEKCPPEFPEGMFLGNYLQCLPLKVILCSKFSEHLVVIDRRQGGHYNVSQQDGQVYPDAPAYPEVVLKRN